MFVIATTPPNWTYLTYMTGKLTLTGESINHIFDNANCYNGFFRQDVLSFDIQSMMEVRHLTVTKSSQMIDRNVYHVYNWTGIFNNNSLKHDITLVRALSAS